MKVIIDTAENIAALAAQQYVDLLKRKPNAILGGATGSTPLGLYAELVRLNKEGKISFKDASSFNLDEYVGLDGTHDQSYRYFMDHNLFDHIDIDKSRTRVTKPADACRLKLRGKHPLIIYTHTKHNLNICSCL